MNGKDEMRMRHCSMESFKGLVSVSLGARGKADGISVRVLEVFKVNDSVLTGMEVKKTSDNVGVVMYLDSWLERYNEGDELDVILDDMYAHVMERLENADKVKLTVQDIADYDRVYKDIYFTIISYDKNKEFLSNKPYVRKLDFAVIFKVFLGHDDLGLQSITITNAMVDSWEVTLEDLWSVAFANTLRLMPVTFVSLVDILRDTMGELGEMLGEPPKGVPPMYVLSNTYGIFGATAILYPSVLTQIAKTLNTSRLLLIPSSVHEVLVLDWEGKGVKDIERVAHMIVDVNESSVKAEEVLGERPYIFEVEEKVLSRV